MIVCMRFAEQQTTVRVVRRLVLMRRSLDARAGMHMQAEQPREDEPEAQKPDGGQTKHRFQLTTRAKPAKRPEVANRRHRR